MAICICKKRRNRHCEAHPGFTRRPPKQLTPKQHVRAAYPKATLDFSELRLWGNGKPAYFILHGLQGNFLHNHLFATPRAAWKAAYDTLLESLARRRKKAE